MDRLLCGQVGKVQLPFPYLFPPFICDLLQARLRRLGICQRLRLIEQRELLRKRLRLFAGRAQQLPLRQPQLLGQPIYLPV